MCAGLRHKLCPRHCRLTGRPLSHCCLHAGGPCPPLRPRRARRSRRGGPLPRRSILLLLLPPRLPGLQFLYRFPDGCCGGCRVPRERLRVYADGIAERRTLPGTLLHGAAAVHAGRVGHDAGVPHDGGGRHARIPRDDARVPGHDAGWLRHAGDEHIAELDAKGQQGAELGREFDGPRDVSGARGAAGSRREASQFHAGVCSVLCVLRAVPCCAL